jgi:hypothetical protein
MQQAMTRRRVSLNMVEDFEVVRETDFEYAPKITHLDIKIKIEFHTSIKKSLGQLLCRHRKA